jgi:hypothetical protein
MVCDLVLMYRYGTICFCFSVALMTTGASARLVIKDVQNVSDINIVVRGCEINNNKGLSYILYLQLPIGKCVAICMCVFLIYRKGMVCRDSA